MNDSIKVYRDRLVNWWNALSGVQRLRLGVVVALGLAIIGTGYGILTSPHWQPLYTNLNARTAGQITAQLNQMKVPYQLQDQGRTILVPQKDVDQVRVDLADRNIPSSGTVGMPAPLTFTLGETDQEIQLTQLANLEAALATTIDSISGIHQSRVLINEPPPNLFGESQSSATASVFVNLNPGASLSNAQVRGIMNLVAHSVSGLSVNQVSVVDQNGVLLSAGVLNNTAAAQTTGMTAAELNAEANVENHIRSAVESMLTQVLGPGQAVVRVNAALNFNQSNISSVKYGPSVLSSQQVQTSSSKQAAGTTTPPAGTGSNVPVYPTVTATGPSSSSQKTTISHWLVDTTKTNETIPAGAIQRLTVGVVVDKRLSAAEVATLKNLVAAAAGFNPAQGDVVTVVGQPFNRSAVNAAMAAMAKAAAAQRLRQQIALAAAAVLLLGLGVVLFRVLRRSRPQPAVLMPAAGQEEAMPAMSVADLLNEIREAKEPSLAEVAKNHLDQLVKSDPEGVARLIRAWLQEDGV